MIAKKVDTGKRILVVDDDSSMLLALAETLGSCGYGVETAINGLDALKKFKPEEVDLVITDLRMPKKGGMDLLREIKAASPATPVIVITAYGTVNTAVEAMKIGASEFIMKPFSLEELEGAVRNVLAIATEEGKTSGSSPGMPSIITRNQRMLSLLDMLKAVAKSKCTITIQGESGTGKELLAKYIHWQSNRRNMPFVAVNCAAIPDNLLESEMFGFEKGAFTGASYRKPGKFELAHGGTLLLDEIGEMGINLQAKLLRVLQEGEVDRLGGKEPYPVDVRIIATTNADLRLCVAERKFREDLFYRLHVIPINVPPLRDRKGDIALLSEQFVNQIGLENGRPRLAIEPRALAILEKNPWPGNVRELRNTLERAVLIGKSDVILAEDLLWDQTIALKKADDFFPDPVMLDASDEDPPEHEGSRTESGTLWEMERSLIMETLQKAKGNRTLASKILGISVRTMRNKLRAYTEEGNRESE